MAAERGAPSANLTSYPRALWWSAETATTVGYGGFYPVTFWGRVIACVEMFVGITTYGIITAAIATWFVGREQKRSRLAAAARDGVRREEERLRSDAEELHERFDRLEHLITSGGGGGGGSAGDGGRCGEGDLSP